MRRPPSSGKGPGRPRHSPEQIPGTPREQVLHAAGHLFTTLGYANTSTREIAELVGIRQASLYFHFAGKGEIVLALLGETLRPTVDSVARIQAITDDPETALFLLALIDVRTLATAAHNVGLLYTAADVSQVEGFEEFAAARDDLASTYARLASPIMPPRRLATIGQERLGHRLIHAVEEVIALRAAGRRVDMEEAARIASSCLLLCGVEDTRIEVAVEVAQDLLDQVDSIENDALTR